MGGREIGVAAAAAATRDADAAAVELLLMDVVTAAFFLEPPPDCAGRLRFLGAASLGGAATFLLGDGALLLLSGIAMVLGLDTEAYGFVSTSGCSRKTSMHLDILTPHERLGDHQLFGVRVIYLESENTTATEVEGYGGGQSAVVDRTTGVLPHGVPCGRYVATRVLHP